MRKLLLVLMGFFLLSLNVRADVISINAKKTGITSSGSGYLTSATTFEKGGVTFGINQFIPSSGQMRVNNTLNSAFTFYNTTAVEGLQEVRITHDVSTVGTMYMRIGTSAISGTVSTSDIKGSTVQSGKEYVTTFTIPASKSGTFFKIQIQTKGSGTVKASKFEIEHNSNGGTVTEKTAPPVISGENPFTDKTTVSITAEEGAKIYYLTDGYTPMPEEQYLYTAPFEITTTTKVIAIAKAEGKLQSDPVTVEFSKVLDGTWMLVKDASELELGARYAIGFRYSNGTGRVVSTEAVQSNKLQGVEAAISNGVLTPNDKMMIFTLERGTFSYSYYLKSNNYNDETENYYLNITSASSTNVNMGKNKQDVYLTYTAGSSDVKIQNGTSDTRMLRGSNSNAAVFGYYASSNTGYHNIQLYKEVDKREACTAPTVTITPANVVEGGSAIVKIEGIASGETVRYTTDGTTPSATEGTVYNGEFTLTNVMVNTTVKAIAYAEGKKNSTVAEGSVTVTLKPRMPKVTWSIGGTAFTAENDGAYEVPEGTVLTITAVNGDKVKVTNEETGASAVRPSPNTLTVSKDMMVSFASVNSDLNLESDALGAIFTVQKVMPGTPVVTWTMDGKEFRAVNDEEYEVYAGTEINVSSSDATKIVVTGDSNSGEFDNPYTFTVLDSDVFTFTGKNANGKSADISVMFTVIERPAEQTYRLVTDASQLKAGNKYVIAFKGNYSNWDYTEALSNNGNWSANKNEYRPSLSSQNGNFTIDDNGILHDRTFGTTSQEGIMVFTLDGTPGKWTLTADNYILPTTQNATEPEAGNMVKLETNLFRMTTSASPLTISVASNGDASITSSEAEGYVMKYQATSTRFGMAKVSNDFPLVQIYGYEPIATPKPECPTVTYTKTIDGSDMPTEEGETYTAINGSKITITSKNATSIDVNGTRYIAANGVYSFTTDVDVTLLVQGVNEAGESESYIVDILIDYEAATIPEMHNLSLKQYDRNVKNKQVNAPVKFTGWAFVTGHYMTHELYEHVWVEDADGNASVIFDDDNGDLAETTILTERSTMMRNFIVRASNYAGESNAMQLIAWPEHTAEHVQSCSFPQVEKHNSIGKTNEFKCVRFEGDMTFTADGGSMQLADGTFVKVANVLTFKNNGMNSPARMANDTFNWLPGQAWPEAGTKKQGIHIAGYVMPAADGGHEFYPAQVTDSEGNITGVDGVKNDGDNNVYVEGGVIMAPAGSHIFGLGGNAVQSGQAIGSGVYVVVTPNGSAVKVLVK